MGKRFYLTDEEYKEFISLFPETNSLYWVVSGDGNNIYYEIEINDLEENKQSINNYNNCFSYLNLKPSYNVPDHGSEEIEFPIEPYTDSDSETQTQEFGSVKESLI